MRKPASSRISGLNCLFGADFFIALEKRVQACEIERTPRYVVAVHLMPKGDACKGVGKPFSLEMRKAQR